MRSSTSVSVVLVAALMSACGGGSDSSPSGGTAASPSPTQAPSQGSSPPPPAAAAPTPAPPPAGNPPPPAGSDAPDPVAGKALYRQTCAECHGVPNANVRRIGNAANTPTAIKGAIANNAGGLMGALQGRFTDAQLADIAAYIAADFRTPGF